MAITMCTLPTLQPSKPLCQLMKQWFILHLKITFKTATTITQEFTTTDY